MESGWARVPVLGGWAPPQRRKASVASTVAAVALVLLAVAAVSLGGTQTSAILLALAVLLVLLLLFQALVVVTGLKQQPLAGGGAGNPESLYAPPPTPAPAAPEAPVAPALPPEGAPQLTLKCSTCGTVFDVADTGERPLRHTCPGCGTQGELTEADIGPPEAAPAPPAAAGITLKCGSCGTVFDVADTGERPLRHTCPGCGSQGELREEDLGPPPAPAPAPKAAAKPRPPAGARTVKTLKLRCKSCSTVFTLRDSGERPLYHECPGCKATGVLR